MRLIMAIILACGLFLMEHSQVYGAIDLPDCSIDLAPCSRAAGNRQVEFDISPKPVRMMKELTFTVRTSGRNTAPTILLELSMPGMYMGRNEVTLTKTPEGAYRGKGIIPRCPSGGKLWRADVTIPGAGKVSYIFNVGK